MPGNFDLEKYLKNSRKVDVGDIDFSEVSRYPLSENEIRCLTYMMDIESHTIVYLRGILSTCAIEDPQTTAFLSCWAYEEHFHGRTIGQFLAAAGVTFSDRRIAEVKKSTSWKEWLKGMGSSLLCQCTRHFHAAYLTYGAISELSTLEGYGDPGAPHRTSHPRGNSAAAGQGRTPPFFLLLQQSSRMFAATQRAAAHGIHPPEILDAGGRRSEIGLRGGLGFGFHFRRLDGRGSRVTHRCHDFEIARTGLV